MQNIIVCKLQLKFTTPICYDALKEILRNALLEDEAKRGETC
jgi:hypothetical protein